MLCGNGAFYVISPFPTMFSKVECCRPTKTINSGNNIGVVFPSVFSIQDNHIKKKKKK